MLIHHSSNTSFRLVAWPQSQASHFMFFSKDKIQYDLTPLLRFIADSIDNTNRAFIFHSTFSLVNVVSPPSGGSYGKAISPNKSITGSTYLSFTFAMKPDDQYTHLDPKFKSRPYQYSVLWGETLNTSSNFLTINVPKKILREIGTSIFMLRDLTWLYMAVGAFTKGFAIRNKYYTSGRSGFKNPDIDYDLAYNKYHNLGMQRAFKKHEYNMWNYVKEFWEIAPNLLDTDSVNDSFCDYYCRYFAAQFYNKYKTKNIKDIETKVESYLEHGIIDYVTSSKNDELGFIGSPEKSTLSHETVIRMLDMVGEDFNSDFSDIRSSVKRLLSSVQRRYV